VIAHLMVEVKVPPAHIRDSNSREIDGLDIRLAPDVLRKDTDRLIPLGDGAAVGSHSDVYYRIAAKIVAILGNFRGLVAIAQGEIDMTLVEMGGGQLRVHHSQRFTAEPVRGNLAVARFDDLVIGHKRAA
jgi:hypothetical protein